jgi:hypothetical protein
MNRTGNSPGCLASAGVETARRDMEHDIPKKMRRNRAQSHLVRPHSLPISRRVGSTMWRQAVATPGAERGRRKEE